MVDLNAILHTALLDPSNRIWLTAWEQVSYETYAEWVLSLVNVNDASVSPQFEEIDDPVKRSHKFNSNSTTMMYKYLDIIMKQKTALNKAIMLNGGNSQSARQLRGQLLKVIPGPYSNPPK